MTISVGEIPRSWAVRDTGSSSPTSSRAVPNKRARLMDSSPSSDGSFHDESLHLRFRHRRPSTYRLTSPAVFPPEQPLRAEHQGQDDDQEGQRGFELERDVAGEEALRQSEQPAAQDRTRKAGTPLQPRCRAPLQQRD